MPGGLATHTRSETLRVFRNPKGLGGSTVAVSNDTGQPMGWVQYDPYGEVLTSTLPVTLTDRLFTGQRLDSSTGLYYYNARYYDPYLGRFIQPDTLVPDPLNPQAWNRFSYCYNNPTSYVDPSGYFVVTVPLLIFGALAFTGAFIGGAAYMAEHPGEDYARSFGFYKAVIGGELLAASFVVPFMPMVPPPIRMAVAGSHLSTYIGDIAYRALVEHQPPPTMLLPRSSWETYLGRAAGSVVTAYLVNPYFLHEPFFGVSPWIASMIGSGTGSFTAQSLEYGVSNVDYGSVFLNAAISGGISWGLGKVFPSPGKIQFGKPLVQIAPGLWGPPRQTEIEWGLADITKAEMGLWLRFMIKNLVVRRP